MWIKIVRVLKLRKRAAALIWMILFRSLRNRSGRTRGKERWRVMRTLSTPLVAISVTSLKLKEDFLMH